MTQNAGAVGGFLKPHLLHVVGLPGLDRLARLIPMASTEKIRITPRITSEYGCSGIVVRMVVAVEG